MQLDSHEEATVRVLVVGGSPEPSRADTVRACTLLADAVVAVDRGLDYALAAGISPDLFCGDADTVSEAGARLVARCEGQAAFGMEPDMDVVRYNPHKDYTDLSLALDEVRRRWPGCDVVCTCVSGGATDHLLGVMGRLVAFAGRVGVVEDGFTARILDAGESWELAGERSRRFSFVPLAPASCVSLSGMRWNLDRAEVGLLSDLGISNVIEDDQASVTCHQGTLFCLVEVEN